MKYFIHILVALCFPLTTFCQDITGLWKGTMFNDSTQQSYQYEIVISKDNGKYTGFSHTCCLINEKKYYEIKKIKVRVAKDGKIVLQDDEYIDNNYPTPPIKEIHQLNVLDLANIGNETTLDGPFATNGTKKYKELTGHVSVKRVSQLSESDLMQYLQKNNRDSNLTVVK